MTLICHLPIVIELEEDSQPQQKLKAKKANPLKWRQHSRSKGPTFGALHL